MALGLPSSRLLRVPRQLLTVFQGLSERETELCSVIMRKVVHLYPHIRELGILSTFQDPQVNRYSSAPIYLLQALSQLELVLLIIMFIETLLQYIH